MDKRIDNAECEECGEEGFGAEWVRSEL